MSSVNFRKSMKFIIIFALVAAIVLGSSEIASASEKLVWKKVPLDLDKISQNTAVDSSLRVDSNGVLYLAVREYISGQYYHRVYKYDSESMTSWQLIYDVGPVPAVAGDGMPFAIYNDVPYIIDWENKHVRKYDERSNNWPSIGETTFVPGTLLGNVGNYSLFVENENSVYVAYTYLLDEANNIDKVKVSKYDGSSWNEVGSLDISGTIYYTSVYAEDDTVYVAFNDDVDRIKVYKYSGDSWELMGDITVTAPGASSPISLGYLYLTVHNGTPYVAYQWKDSPTWIYLGLMEYDSDSGVWQDITGNLNDFRHYPYVNENLLYDTPGVHCKVADFCISPGGDFYWAICSIESGKRYANVIKYDNGTNKWTELTNDRIESQNYSFMNPSLSFYGDKLYLAAYELYAEVYTLMSAYSVTYDSNGAESGTVPVDSNYYIAGETVTLKGNEGNLAKSGYVFDGWNTASDGSGVTYLPGQTIEMQEGGITLYAVWAESYKVTFMNEGKVYHQTEVKKGTQVQPPSAEPVKEGYTFKGWYTDENYTTEWNFSNPVTNDMNLYAKWERIQCTVTFDTQGGEPSIDTQTVYYGEKVAKPDDPAREGHVFLGWFTDEDCTTEWDFENDVVTGNMTLYAKWERNQYTVTFDSKGGSEIDPVKVLYNDPVGKPDDPVRTGYKFLGWYTDEDYTTEWDFSNPVTSDMTLYAKWERIQCTVTFDTQGGGPSIPPQSVYYGEKVTKPDDPVKEGYVFDGWYREPECINPWDFENYEVWEAFTLYAKWTKVSSGGSGSSGSSSSGTTPPAPSNDTPVRINGKDYQDIAETTTKEQDGRRVTSVKLGTDELIENLSSGETGTVITVQVTKDTDTAVVELDGRLAEYLENMKCVLEVKTKDAGYTLPAEEIAIDRILESLGAEVGPEAIRISIEIARASEDDVKIVENEAEKGKFAIIVPPMEFTVKFSYGDTTVEIGEFKGYVARTIAIPEGVDPEKVTTAVIVEKDGTLRHVPTKATVIDGKYYAQINSITNSAYTLIWNPIEFRDVDNHWAKDAVNNLGSRMIISGIGDGLFAPDREITRAEFAAIMVRALGLKPEAKETPFKDVRAGEWYSGNIKTAAEYGIIYGYGNGNFGPNDRITREQAMAMIARAMKITKLNVEFVEGEIERILDGFNDAESISEYAKESIAACVKSGLVVGKSGRIIGPKDNITRAETTVIVQRLLQKSGLI